MVLVNAIFLVSLSALNLVRSFILARELTRTDYGIWGVILISLGTLAAWLWSTIVLVGGLDSDVYFEVAAVVTTLILLGRYLEARAKSRSSEAIRKLLELGAKEARHQSALLASNLRCASANVASMSHAATSPRAA